MFNIERTLDGNRFQVRATERCAQCGAFVAVELQHVQRGDIQHPSNHFRLRIGEQAYSGYEWRQGPDDLGRLLRTNRAWTARNEIKAKRIRPGERRRLRILDASNTADFDPHRHVSDLSPTPLATGKSATFYQRTTRDPGRR